MDENPEHKDFARVPCCSLCGAKIRHKDVLPKWVTQFHTVYATDVDANAKAYLSIAGRRGNDIVDTIDIDPSDIAHHGKKTLRIDLMPEMLDNYALSSRTRSSTRYDAWGYPFHSACWKMLIAFRPIVQQDLQSLLSLGRSMSIKNRMLNYGHNYGGRASQSHSVAPGEESYLLAPVPITNCDVDPGDNGTVHHYAVWLRWHCWDMSRLLYAI